jgi:serine protease inhibitor
MPSPRRSDRAGAKLQVNESAKEETVKLTRVLVLAGMVALTASLPAAQTDKESVNHAATANNAFALDLYGQLAREKSGKSLFFSPYSISNALVIVTEGARGQTADEMGKVLRFPPVARNTGAEARSLPWNTELIHTELAALNKRFDAANQPPPKALMEKLASLRKALQKANEEAKSARDYKVAREAQRLAGEINKLQAQIERYELRVANALWGEKTYPFKKAYLSTINRHYGASAFPVDFRRDYEGARKQINAWVEKQTRDRIKDLVPRNALSKDTTLVVANAIYFKGEWSDPFPAKETKDQPFTLADGATVKFPMMRHTTNAGRYAAFNKDGTLFDTPARKPLGKSDPKVLYPDSQGFEMLELPYKGGDLSMLVLLPREASGLPALEKKLTSANLSAWTARLKQRRTHVFLPKFKLETSYSLKDALEALGMKRAFRDPRLKDGAQFDGMTDAESALEKLYISKVLHKAFVEVSEKGTEAAAATAVIVARPTSAPVTVPFIPTFKADRPFVFLIRDQKTGSVLFLGRVVNPKSAE